MLFRSHETHCVENAFVAQDVQLADVDERRRQAREVGEPRGSGQWRNVIGSALIAEERRRYVERLKERKNDKVKAHITERAMQVALEAVEAHGGRIWIEDAAPGAAGRVWQP